jgi:DNA-binding transcriptional ArsR family regulator
MDERCDLLCLDLPRAEELRAECLPSRTAELVAARVRALADPTRLVIVDALAKGGELCVCDLAWITARAQNLVSHHLRALKEEGLAKSRREGKIVFYALTGIGARLYGQVSAEAISEARPLVGA